jgi:hypothetical protein
VTYYDPIIDRRRTGGLQQAHSSHPRIGRLWSALRGRPAGPTSLSGVCPPRAVRCPGGISRDRLIGVAPRGGVGSVTPTDGGTQASRARAPRCRHTRPRTRGRLPHAHACGAAFGMRGVSGMPRVNGRACRMVVLERVEKRGWTCIRGVLRKTCPLRRKLQERTRHSDRAIGGPHFWTFPRTKPSSVVASARLEGVVGEFLLSR